MGSGFNPPPADSVNGGDAATLDGLSASDFEQAANKDQADGYAGLNEDGHLVGPIFAEVKTAAEHAGTTPDVGRLLCKSDRYPGFAIGDGETAGGLDIGSGLISSDALIIVLRGATDSASADNIRAAYTAAKALTPGGNALSATNRATVLIPPGVYDFGTGNGTNHGLQLDAQYVDLMGLNANPRTTRLTSAIGTDTRGTVEQTVDDVRLANLHLAITSTGGSGGTSDTPAAYFPNGNLPTCEIRNCLFSSAATTRASMRVGVEYSGTYIDCISGRDSFGYLAAASGVFIRCIGGIRSFGASTSGVASGKFIDCVGDTQSFGGGSAGTATGHFLRCRLGVATGYSIALGVTSWGGTFTGLMEDCFWKVTGANSIALRVGASARVYNSTLIGTGSAKSIDADSAINAKIAHCRLNLGIGSNVTNDIGTPYNVEDTDLS